MRCLATLLIFGHAEEVTSWQQLKVRVLSQYKSELNQQLYFNAKNIIEHQMDFFFFLAGTNIVRAFWWTIHELSNDTKSTSLSCRHFWYKFSFISRGSLYFSQGKRESIKKSNQCPSRVEMLEAVFCHSAPLTICCLLFTSKSSHFAKHHGSGGEQSFFQQNSNWKKKKLEKHWFTVAAFHSIYNCSVDEILPNNCL